MEPTVSLAHDLIADIEDPTASPTDGRPEVYALLHPMEEPLPDRVRHEIFLRPHRRLTARHSSSR
jgi:hypothetical protein